MSTKRQADERTDSEERIALDDAGTAGLPIVELLTGRGFITGKSGSGKSNTASVIVEELLDRGFPVLVVDTDGEYWGLKQEYEVLHVGADEECDLQVGPEHAEKLAGLALGQNVPIILDVSGYLDDDEASALIRDTARHLFAKEKTLNRPFLMLVEEIHEYIPEGGGLDETGQMLIRVAKRGRKRGLGIAGLSQRPADVKKDFITQCDWLVWHRLTWENDTKVVRRVVGGDYDEVVQSLADGEALLVADFLEDDVTRVQVRRKDTFDAGATPDLGDFERPELKDVSGDLVAELEEISEQKRRERDRIAELERRLDERDETIAELKEELERARDMSEMAQQFTEALTASGGDAGELQEQVDEIREQKNERIRELEAEMEALEEERDSLKERTQDLGERVDELEEYEQAVENMDELREGVARMAEALGMDTGDGDGKFRKKLRAKEETIDELQAKIDRLQQQGYSLDDEFSEKLDFLKHEAVREEVGRAAAKTTYKEDHAWDALSILVDKDRVRMEDLAPYVEISRSSVSSILSKLQDHHVVKKERKGNDTYYSLNIDGMKDIIQQQRKRTEMEELKNSVKETVK